MSDVTPKSVVIEGVEEYPIRMIPGSRYSLLRDPKQLTTEEIEGQINFFIEQEWYEDAKLYRKELNRRNSLKFREL